MLEIKTKYGLLKIVEDEAHGNYQLLDSEDRILFCNVDFDFIYEQLVRLNNSDSVGDWLKEFDCAWWDSQSLEHLFSEVACELEGNGYKFDKFWASDNYNKIGDTFILFDWNEAYHDYQTLYYYINKSFGKLPKHEELARKIATYVIEHDWDYSEAQIAELADEFYGKSVGFACVSDLFNEGIL